MRSQFGGAIYAGSGAFVTVSNSLFVGNSARARARAHRCRASAHARWPARAHFLSNSARPFRMQSGGAIAARARGGPVFFNSISNTFIANSVPAAAGGCGADVLLQSRSGTNGVTFLATGPSASCAALTAGVQTGAVEDDPLQAYLSIVNNVTGFNTGTILPANVTGSVTNAFAVATTSYGTQTAPFVQPPSHCYSPLSNPPGLPVGVNIVYSCSAPPPPPGLLQQLWNTIVG